MELSSGILKSWEANAQNWITTINQGEIESRLLVTNDAIVNCIVSYSPKNILDIGCGEGWLTRKLRKKGIASYGTDGVEALVKAAIAKDGPNYAHLTYDDIAQGRHTLARCFDAAVINFALIDKDDAENLIQAIPGLLINDGYLFIQTLHPLSAVEEYSTGWKEGSWKGLKQNFVKPYSWYFRTLENWFQLFSNSGFRVEAIEEPVHPFTKKPLSIIFVLKTGSI